jgi:transcriptional regulator with XRE-family HTH domain
VQIVKKIYMNEQIGGRIKEERKNLGYQNQAALAEKLNVSLGSVHNYESGKRSPDAEFLSRFAEAGADVLYVLTGQHASGTEYVLSPDEAALLDNFRAIPPARKFSLIDVASALASAHGDKKKAGDV